MVNLSKEGLLSHCKRFSRIKLSLDGLVFLKVGGDIPICASLSHHNRKNCIYHTCIHKPHLTLNPKGTKGNNFFSTVAKVGFIICNLSKNLLKHLSIHGVG